MTERIVNGHRIGAWAGLYGANLYGANLRGANLRGANLYGANLGEANLYGANLGEANLRGADLYGADLYGANLYGANLGGANLRGADLRGANLGRADLGGANLGGADLRGANLYGANLGGANLGGANGLEQFRILPDEGDLIVWKKAAGGLLVKMRVPADARRGNAPGGRKCRAERAEVLAIINPADESVPIDLARSKYDPLFTYRVGEIVEPTAEFDPLPQNECAPGIHFFITRAEAEAWL